MKICMYGASSSELEKDYYEEAYALGAAMAKRGHSLVFGGGKEGLMGSAVKGLDDNGGYSIGIAPTFFDKPGVLYENCSEFHFTETMRQRKQLMEDSAEAFITVPGGIGTFEEFFETLTLRQLGRHNKPIAILNTNDYYNPLVELLKHAENRGFMKGRPIDDMFGVFYDIDELLDYLESNIQK